LGNGSDKRSVGNRNYIVRFEDKELVWRRYINHIIKLEEFIFFIVILSKRDFRGNYRK